MNILDLIQADIFLTKKGKDWWGLCPWHGEKTPSFSVAPEKEMYYCFGCGAHGDAIDWLRHCRGYSYRDAAKAVGKELDSSRKPAPASPLMLVARAYLALEEEQADFALAWAFLRARLRQAAALPDLYDNTYRLQLASQFVTMLDWLTALDTLWRQIKDTRDRLLEP